MLKEDRYHYACHEAAHAVVCLREKMTFQCIRLCNERIESPNGLGPAQRHGQFVPTDDSLTRATALSETKISLAGIAFEKLLRPHYSYAALCVLGQAASDFHNAMDTTQYGLYDNDNRREIERFIFKHLYPPVRALVIEDWPSIAAVGDALQQRGQLNQAEVVNVMHRVKSRAR